MFSNINNTKTCFVIKITCLKTRKRLVILRRVEVCVLVIKTKYAFIIRGVVKSKHYCQRKTPVDDRGEENEICSAYFESLMHRRSQRYFYCNYSCPFVKARLRKKSLGAIITRWVERGSVVDPEPHCAPALGQWWVTGLWGIVTSGRRPSQNRGRNRRQGRRPVNDPPSLCLRGFSSNLHCRIVNRTCCNLLRLKRHENKRREKIKHILWRY